MRTKKERSQFSVGQTAQTLTCSVMEKPHTVFLRILLKCFRKRGSGLSTPSSPTYRLLGRYPWSREPHPSWPSRRAISSWGLRGAAVSKTFNASLKPRHSGEFEGLRIRRLATRWHSWSKSSLSKGLVGSTMASCSSLSSMSGTFTGDANNLI